MNAPRSRPGIRFTAEATSSTDRLVRMDVAMFVGFARRGPVDYPVAIDDIDQFDAVFGPAPRLLWDSERQDWNEGHLAAAVRSFFSNGGRRCWVSRVADAGAQSGRFDLPGCVRVEGAGSALRLGPAMLQASSEGSWSDTLTLAARVQAQPVWVDVVADGSGFELRVSAAVLQVGDLLRLALAGTQGTGWYPVQEILAPATDGRQQVDLGAGVVVRLLTDTPAAVPPAVPVVQLSTAGSWRVEQGGRSWQVEAAPAPLLASPWAAAVTLELQVDSAEGGRWPLPGLGLVAGASRFVGGLPTDAQRPAALPGLPLAGAEAAPPAAGAALFYLPLGLTDAFEGAVAAQPSTTAALVRDGLSYFDAALFLDPALAEVDSAELMARADDLRYRAELPRRLRGLHVALGWHDNSVGDETTLIAVPDAVHQPWSAAVRQDPGYRWASTPQPPVAVVETFGDCVSPLPAPQLEGLIDTDAGAAVLSWSLPAGLEPKYELQAATATDFAAPLWQLRLTELRFEMPAADAAGCSFRVRARTGDAPGAWSPTLTLLREPQFAAAAEPEANFALQVHQALLRLCAARMDLFAVLALPQDCREAQALQHARQLSTLLADDGRLASFGALYHPWIETAASGAPLRPRPPDGAACGQLAACARDRGAWVAPANRLLQGALALHPQLIAQTAAFAETGINLLEPGRGGIRLFSAQTLSENAALRPLQVRRLLILLRRLASRMGNELVFEPQGPALHAAVERRFELWLGTLFRRGAFAGAREEDAFRVVVESALDGGRSAERGELVVNLQVRPAQALQFLQLRLLIGGASGTDWQEAA